MKNTIRCCIACILPCGALDVIRIVHTNGRVEEISGSIRASEVMKAHPKHILKKPSSSSSYFDENGVVTVPKIVIVPPDAELQRGKIYFLMPVPPSSSTMPDDQKTRSATRASRKKKRESSNSNSWSGVSNITWDRVGVGGGGGCGGVGGCGGASLLISDRYLREILSEKLSTQRERRRGRVGVWRPHLESISETPVDQAF